MKTILAAVLTIIGGSIAAAQTRPSEAPPQERPTGAAVRPNGEDERARIAAHNEWPKRPKVGKPAEPPKYTVFKTNFLVNNESDKEIREIKWTATLINRETQETIQTFPLQTKKKISAHKTGKLKERLVVPMKKLQGQVVSATEPVKDPAKALEVDTKYEIIEIIYKDKSISRP